MDNLVFKHPRMKTPLSVHVNPNQIEWNYGLNVANLPTYGGEVIQILSAYIDDMAIQGNVSTYAQMERIYKWFAEYIETATAEGEYDVTPVGMFYKARGWHFKIYPKTLPGLRYGTEVVTPEWTMNAAVVDPDQSHPLKQEIMTKAKIETLNQEHGFSLFGKATGNIGFELEDPFSDPLGQTKANEKRLLNGTGIKGSFHALADRYNKLLPAYLEGNFEDLTADYSKPVVKGNLNEGTAKAKHAVDNSPKGSPKKAK